MILKIKNLLPLVACGCFLTLLAAPDKINAQGATIKPADSQNNKKSKEDKAAQDKASQDAQDRKRAAMDAMQKIYDSKSQINGQPSGSESSKGQTEQQKDTLDSDKKKEDPKEIDSTKFMAAMAEFHKQIENAKPGFDSAAVIVMGRETRPGELEQWVAMMGKDPNTTVKVAEGVKFPDAVIFLKQFVSQPAAEGQRNEIIAGVFREVYGRNPTGAEREYWNQQIKSQKSWYAPMVVTESDKLKNQREERRATINRVYRATMGRDANANEFSYWQPRPEHFRLMREATRNYMYSKEGGKDLFETVSRYIFEYLPKDKQPDTNVNETLQNFKKNKWIYADVAK